jgi:energy-coupling factor transporter ATP-binding protein EcfA2/energy-coupling factor transporter transmembrane protein EcfT
VIYRRHASPMHAARAGAGCAYCAALAIAALVLSAPVALGAVGVALLGAAACAGVWREMRRAAMFALPLGLLVMVVNALVVRDGLTVIARLGSWPVLGQVDVTLEATVAGAVLGLRAIELVLCGALYTAAIDPDEVLRLFRRVSFHSALTATLATRMVPVLARDARRLSDAQRCRPGRPPSRVQLMRAASSGVLDSGAGPRWTAGGVGELRIGSGAPCSGRGRRGGDGAGAADLRAPAVPGSKRDLVSVLSLEHVTYTYPGAPAPALLDVSLEIEPGELVVLAGASGSGKSTLLRAVCGLAPHFYGGVFAGRATVAGMDTRGHGPGELAAAVGTLFQDPETQVVMGTVRAELALPLENRGEPGPSIARAVEEVALALGVGHLLDRPTAELSGGELQRVALGAALVGRPRVIVLDEPTSQLDPVAGDELITLLRRLGEDFDTAIVLAEHRLERCLPFADRAVAMRGGRVACDGTPAEFLAWASAAARELATPGARLLSGLGLTPVAGVRAARSSLRAGGLLPDLGVDGPQIAASERTGSRRRRRAEHPALEFDRVWHELDRGPTILRGVSLSVRAGERLALMGRNGAGKSTLLRHAAGLMRPTRGKVRRAGPVALLLQNPTDYLVHERVDLEASAAALATVGLGDPAQAGRHPRDLSGGEKQRLALAIVLDDPDREVRVLCLDEPTRGMDRRRKDELAALLCELGAAVIVATHDPEFVAAFAERVVLLADGAPIADGSPSEVLAGGTYFATETARILGGAGGALRPEDGVAFVSRVVTTAAGVGA